MLRWHYITVNKKTLPARTRYSEKKFDEISSIKITRSFKPKCIQNDADTDERALYRQMRILWLDALVSKRKWLRLQGDSTKREWIWAEFCFLPSAKDLTKTKQTFFLDTCITCKFNVNHAIWKYKWERISNKEKNIRSGGGVTEVGESWWEMQY